MSWCLVGSEMCIRDSTLTAVAEAAKASKIQFWKEKACLF
jgi:hypothetical protein